MLVKKREREFKEAIENKETRLNFAMNKGRFKVLTEHFFPQNMK